MGSINKDKKFKPTVEYLAEKYKELNKTAFKGMLGNCEFELYSKGSKTLGHFYLSGKNLKCERNGRKRIFTFNPYTGERTYITKDTFYEVCRPVIGLNANYSGTEDAILSTLVHEMVHYATYMNGQVPLQAHGTEFKRYAEYVSINSDGKFSVQRLASAEEMSNYELDAEIQARLDAAKERKKDKVISYFIFFKDGSVYLANASSRALVNTALNYYRGKRNVSKIVMSTDKNLINLLFQNGYKRVMRKFGNFWNVGKEPFIKNLTNDYDCTILWQNEDNSISESTMEGNITKLTVNELKYIIRESIWRIKEAQGKPKRKGDNEVVSITPGMDLGQETPIDYAR